MPASPKWFMPILVILSGILSGIAIGHQAFWLVWIALLPFLAIIITCTPGAAFLSGFLYGLAEASVLLNWIVPITQRYSGSQTLLGIPIFLVTAVYYALYPALFAVVFTGFLGKSARIQKSITLQVFMAGSLWTLCEWLKLSLLSGLPWVKYTLAFSQSANLHGLQLAALTGQWGISFTIVAVNLLLVRAVLKRDLNALAKGGGLLTLFYGFGLCLLHLNAGTNGRSLHVAMLQENLKAETKWQPSTGDSLAGIFLDLNRKAAALNPDLILWSETALPWTFSPNDDLLTLALNITQQTGTGHLLGSLSRAAGPDGKIYNSAYYIQPDGRVTSRYDKVDLLAFIERPFLRPSLRIPFLSAGLRHNALAGTGTTLMNTPQGSIGVLICNESLLPELPRKAVDLGADFLVNISNDAWFAGTRLVDHHFLYARMRAVETGKPMAINSNRGISGIVQANGRITRRQTSDLPACIHGTLYLTSSCALYQILGDWVIYAGLLFICAMGIDILRRPARRTGGRMKKHLQTSR